MGFQAPPATVERQSFESQQYVTETPQTDDPESARILALFRAGKSIAEIVREITGASSGAKYNEMRAKIERLLRERV